MLPRVIQARYINVNGCAVWLRFADGSVGTVDLSDELAGPMLEPLRDVALSAQVQLHRELHTLVWSNGADLAPELLHANLRAAE